MPHSLQATNEDPDGAEFVLVGQPYFRTRFSS